MVGSKRGPRVMQAPAVLSSGAPAREERPVLFQHYFKSGSRTYAAQVKQSSSGRPFLVLTEGRRDPQTDEVHKTRIMVFNDDLASFFHLLQETATFLRPLRGSKTALPPAAPASAVAVAPTKTPEPPAKSPAALLKPVAKTPLAPNARAASPAERFNPNRSPAKPGSAAKPTTARPAAAARIGAPARPANGKTQSKSFTRSVAAQPAKPGRR